MKKIKKSLAIVAALLLMSSSMNAITPINCEDLAVVVHHDLMDQGYSHAEAYAISQGVLDRCLEMQE